MVKITRIFENNKRPFSNLKLLIKETKIEWTYENEMRGF
jgi:hypothetical protein